MKDILKLGFNMANNNDLMLNANYQDIKTLIIADKAEERREICNLLSRTELHEYEDVSTEIGLNLIFNADKSDKPYDVVFTILKLPNMEGIDFGSRFKSMKLNFEPIIIWVLFRKEPSNEDLHFIGTFSSITSQMNHSTLNTGMKSFYKYTLDLKSLDIGFKTRIITSILLVDDNLISQEIIRYLLEKVKINITVVEDDLMAIQMAELTNFDLILININMLVRDDYKAYKHLKKIKHLKNTPIILLNVNTYIEKQNILYANINDDYLIKPFEPSNLYKILAKWIPKNVFYENINNIDQNLLKEGICDLEIVKSLKAIRGLDFKIGLRYVLGDVKFYVKLLRNFAEIYGNDAEKIICYTDSKELEDIKVIALRLSEAAGFLGLKKVSILTSRLVNISENIDEIKSLAIELALELGNFLVSLEMHLHKLDD